MRIGTSVCCPLLALLLAGSASAGRIYVDPLATGSNDGSSWANAFDDLRVALDSAVAGDDLWVAQGTYVPGPSAQESDSFFLKSGVRLYGGFVGGETRLAQRDFVAHPTVLSGDVGGDDVYGNPWYSGWNINTANSAHVLTANGVDASAVLDGFIVRAGHTGPVGTPAGSSEMYGSGIYILGGGPTLENCVFERNLAAFASGAAVYDLDASPTIRSCTFRENWVHLGSGAGIFNYGASQPVIEDCLFQDNIVTSGSGGSEAQGAAIGNWSTPPITIARCTFEGNSAQAFYASGAVFEIPRGGAISSFGDGLVVRECVFRSNHASAGGAISLWGRSTIVNSLFLSNFVTKVTIQGQSTGGWGGAISSRPGAGDLVEIVGCSIVANQAGEAAVYGLGSAATRVADCVLWANTASGQGVSLRGAQYKGSIDLSYSCVEGLFAPDVNDPPPPPSNVPGSIDLDPQFVDLPGLDLHLGAGSPCIDTGSNAALPGVAALDLDGNVRIAQGASSFTVDMGTYEFGSQAPGVCPVILLQPQPLTVLAGEAAGFDVLATGESLTFQWRRNGLPLVDGGAISGATSPSLSIAPTSTADAGSYDVLLSNSCGTTPSAAASLTVGTPPIGTVFCSGDGNLVNCPCGNDKDPGAGCENSTGEGAALTAAGSASVAADDAVLTTVDLPSNTIGLHFLGTSKAGGGAGTPFGDGLLCVLPKFRFQGAGTGTSGSLVLSSPAAKAPNFIQPGATVHFQCWYRDNSGPCGSGFSTSNGLTITFVP